MQGPATTVQTDDCKAGDGTPTGSRAVEALLLAVTRVETLNAGQRLTNATGFFFERAGRIFLVTSRHVLLDEASGHRPDEIDVEFHVDPDNVAATTPLRVPLYRDGLALWREARDSGGLVDVAALALDAAALPQPRMMHAFTPAHLVLDPQPIEVGDSVLVVGFPLGFQDELHHLPVARKAVVASSFGMRFGGNGYFLTDARLHRGASGAPVVARAAHAQDEDGREGLPWLLLGVHASRLDVERDLTQDSRLDLNCAWYADVLETLTEEAETAAPPDVQTAPAQAGPAAVEPATAITS